MLNVLLTTAIIVAAMFVLPELVAWLLSWMLHVHDESISRHAKGKS